MWLAREVIGEGVESLRPERPVVGEPLLHMSQGLGLENAPMDPPVDGAFHELGLLEHPEVFADAGIEIVKGSPSSRTIAGPLDNTTRTIGSTVTSCRIFQGVGGGLG